MRGFAPADSVAVHWFRAMTASKELRGTNTCTNHCLRSCRQILRSLCESRISEKFQSCTKQNHSFARFETGSTGSVRRNGSVEWGDCALKTPLDLRGVHSCLTASDPNKTWRFDLSPRGGFSCVLEQVIATAKHNLLSVTSPRNRHRGDSLVAL